MTVHSGSRRPLPHLAYLEALASTEEDSPRWHALTAGYAVLQLFDAWAGVDGGVLPPTGLEQRRVRKRLAAVAPGDPVRRCLTQLVDVIEQPSSRNGYTAILRVRDSRGGSSPYRQVAYWEPAYRYGRN